MFKNIILVTMMLLTSLIHAKEAASLYQIDLIVFAHQTLSTSPELSLSSTLTAPTANRLILQTEVSKNLTPYHLLPSSFSQLSQEYWALHRKQQYRVLLHYSWLQPFNNQLTITIPQIQRDGWELEGSIRVLRKNYYAFDANLLISSANLKIAPFILAQQQRLKGGSIYYLDHPQAGMLIKVHQLT